MYLLMNIGCIECDVTSAIVGVFTDRERADALAVQLDDTHSWRQGGQNRFEVFEVPQPDVISIEYLVMPE